MKKKIVAVFILTMALLCLFGIGNIGEVNIFAAEVDIASGKSNNVSWKIDPTGHLVIKGTGDWDRNGSSEPWFDYRYSIQSAEVHLTGTTNAAGMFDGCVSLKELTLRDFNTENVTDMSYMFNECDMLEDADVGHFDTKNVTDMSYMFNGCTILKELDVSGFNTSNVTNMENMFSGCDELKKIDVNGFDTKKVANMTGMFYHCLNLREIDISGFDTRNVIATESMFEMCWALQTIDLSVFDVSKNASDMLMIPDIRFCTLLRSIKTPLFIHNEVELPNYYCNPRTGEIFDKLSPKNADKTAGKTLYRVIMPEEDKSIELFVPFEKTSLGIKWSASIFQNEENTHLSNPEKENLDLAIAGLTLSSASENSKDRVEEILGYMGMWDTKSNKWYESEENANFPAMTLASGKIYINGKLKNLVVATIRGTKSFWGDLVSDIHSQFGFEVGFVEPADNTLNQIKNYISDKYGNEKEEDFVFFVTGHSLGGAVATLVGQRLNRDYPNATSYVYSFAPPKYGKIHDVYSDNIHEYVNTNDIVTKMPIGIFDRVHKPHEFRGDDFSLAGKYAEIMTDNTHYYYMLPPSVNINIFDEYGNHSNNIYMAYLLTRNEQGDEWHPNNPVERVLKSIWGIFVKCPVDVNVYDDTDKLLARIVNNKVDSSVTADNVWCQLDDDKKYIYIASDKDIHIKLRGFDTGEMEYSVWKLGEDASEPESKVYQAIKLEPSKEFRSDISQTAEEVSNVTLQVIDSETGEVVKNVEENGEETDVIPSGDSSLPRVTDTPAPTGTLAASPTPIPSGNSTKTPSATTLPSNMPGGSGGTPSTTPQTSSIPTGSSSEKPPAYSTVTSFTEKPDATSNPDIAPIFSQNSPVESGGMSNAIGNNSNADKKDSVKKLSKPVIKSMKRTAGRKIKVTIKKVSKASGYQIQYAKNKKFKKASKTITKKPESVSLATYYFLQPYIIPAFIRCFTELIFSPNR